MNHTRRDIELYINHNLVKFNSFITLTFRDEVTNISVANKKFQNFIRSWKRLKGDDFYYIGVPEYQKNGRVHYHILTSLVCGVDIDKKINKRVKSDGKFINLKYYDIKYWSYGFSSALDIKKEVDDKFNACAYLCKYLYKDFDNRLWSHKKILKSNNLFKPTTYFLNLDMQDILFFNVYLQEKGLEIHSYAIDSDKNFIPSHNSYVSSFVNINDFSNLLEKFKDKIVFTE